MPRSKYGELKPCSSMIRGYFVLCVDVCCCEFQSGGFAGRDEIVPKDSRL